MCKLTCSESAGKARAAAHAPFSVQRDSSRTVLIQIDAGAASQPAE